MYFKCIQIYGWTHQNVDAVISILMITSLGCVVVGELEIFFFGRDACSAYNNLNKEESRSAILSLKYNSVKYSSQKTQPSNIMNKLLHVR
jgi:hypothetical protein